MNTKISYRGLLSLVYLLFSCQLIAPVSQPSATPQPSFSSGPTATSSESPPPESSPTAEAYDLEAAFKAFYLKLEQPAASWTNCRPDLDVPISRNVETRKSLLAKQIIHVAETAQDFDVKLNSTDDLKRRLLFNVRQGSVPVSSLKVWVNNREVQSFFPNHSLLRTDVPDMVLDLCAYFQPGHNTVTVRAQGETESSAEVFLDGFIMPVDIPDALHSLGGDAVASEHVVAGHIDLKFMEGMKVRLDRTQSVSEQWVDLSGISLYPLQLALQFYSVEAIYPHSTKTPEEEDAKEQEKEKEYTDYPNGNLFYLLVVEEGKEAKELYRDMQELRDSFYRMRLFEEVAFEPKFESASLLLRSR